MKRIEPFRIAIREVEDTVVAYLAPMESEEGWLELGRVRKRVLDDCPTAHKHWIEMWKAAATELITTHLPELKERAAVEVREPREKKA